MRERYWVRGASRLDRQNVLAGLALPPLLAAVDGHRNLRGPYSAAGSLMRAIFQDLKVRCPELVTRHRVELLTTAPELSGEVPDPWHSLEWTVKASERTRYYSRLHTRNVANGIAELLRDYLAVCGSGDRALVIENAHHADPADQDFIAVMLRRGDLDQLTVVVATDFQPLADPLGEIDLSLAETLAEHGQVIDAPTIDQEFSGLTGLLAARAFVESDCTSDDPNLLAAYNALELDERARLHDQRRACLDVAAEPSLALGAVALHAELGSDPHGAGVQALRHAMDRCHSIGLYQAAVDYGLRGRRLIELRDDPASWWHFTDVCSVSMASLGRADEAEQLYLEGQTATADPLLHLDFSYGMAMLHARHYPEKQRDYAKARAWMNVSIALASLLGDAKQRAFQSVFASNGLALVEVRERNAQEALRLLENGMARLDAELEPDEHRLHRIVLRYNRAQVYAGMGRWADALADFQAVIEVDPHFAEHHFNAANMLRQLGRPEEALAAYRHSLDITPPYPEAYYNIADTLLELGDLAGALDAFSYTLELDPKHVDARLNRANLRYQTGDIEGAWADVAVGLVTAPRSSHLLCLRGSLLSERGDQLAALASLTEAIEADPKLAEAWASRGVVRLAMDEVSSAIEDLDTAVNIRDTAEFRFNRALAYEKAGRYVAAIADYDAILATTDDAEARERREGCLASETAS